MSFPSFKTPGSSNKHSNSCILSLHSRDCVHIFILMKLLFSVSDPEINMVNSINLQSAHSLLKMEGGGVWSVKTLINEQRLKLLGLAHASNFCQTATSHLLSLILCTLYKVFVSVGCSCTFCMSQLDRAD